jgi:hypothetical protein
MAQTITRMFDTVERANAAAQALQHHRIRAYDEVHVVSAAPGDGIDAIVEAFARAMVLKSDGRVLAQGVSRGHAVVVVHAPFGTAREAVYRLDEFGPIDSGLSEHVERLPAWDDAAPLSSALNIPVLVGNDDSLSRFFSMPLLIRSGRTTSAAFGFAELKATPSPWTTSLGLPLLSSNPAPLSSLLHMPVLKRATPI